MIHQELALIPELTVAQNVLLGNEGREVLNYAQMEARVRAVPGSGRADWLAPGPRSSA